MKEKALARKKGILGRFSYATGMIWVTNGFYLGYGKVTLVHFMDHKKSFGCDYFACNNITDLNEIKSKILNLGFKIDWNSFNLAMEHLNDPTTH